MRSGSFTSRVAHPALQCAGAGLGAALLLLVHDAVQVRITFGTWSLASGSTVLLTMAAGLVLSFTTWAVWLLSVRVGAWARRPNMIETFALSFALLYGLATLFRFTRVAMLRQIGAWAPPLAALVVWAAAVFILQRIGAATGRGWLGTLCAAFFLSLFLVGNRELVGHPTSSEALLFDAVGFVFAVVVLLGLRSRRPANRRLDRAFLIAGLTVAFLLATFTATHIARRQGLAARLAEAVASATEPKPPHVVLVVFDTMRGDVFEDVLSRTAEGRAFAEALGPTTWFDQATAAGPWTAPSMSSVMTGLHPLQHQVRTSWGHRIPRDHLTLGEHLRANGYQTLAVVANRALERSIGVDRGFQIYESLPTARDLAALGHLERLLPEPRGPAREPESWFVDARQARQVLRDRLRLVDPDQPVFLWYHLMDTHGPLKEHPSLPVSPGDDRLTPTQRAYRTNARFALAETATALEAIQDRLGVENTLTIVLSDHGEMLAADNHLAPGRPADDTRRTGHAHTFFDTLIRVPLGIRLPDRQSATEPRPRSHRLVSHLDVVPTVLDVLDLTWPTPLMGCSLAALTGSVDDREPEHCHPFVVSDGSTGPSPHSSLRTPRLKLMASPDDAFAPLLFDLEADPREQQNRAHDEPDATASALALLRRFWEEYTSDRPAAAGDLDPAQIETLRALGYL